jgi:acetylornithine/succinyldiaminopimelate/putrescine aminotransferase
MKSFFSVKALVEYFQSSPRVILAYEFCQVCIYAIDQVAWAYVMFAASFGQTSIGHNNKVVFEIQQKLMIQLTESPCMNYLPHKYQLSVHMKIVKIYIFPSY